MKITPPPVATDEVIRRIGVLLSILDSAASEAVLSGLPENSATLVRQELNRLQDTPPAEEEIDGALGELARLLKYVDQAAQQHAQATAHDESAPTEEPEVPEPVAPAPASDDPIFEPTDDPIADLIRLHPLRLAGALGRESPRAVAMLLRVMPNERVSDVLPKLPEAMRTEVFLHLNAAKSVNRELAKILAATAVKTALSLDMAALIAEQAPQETRIAKLLRSMSREDRSRIFEALDEQDSEAANRIREALYSFEDMIRVDDRTLQKVLTEIDSATLASALKGADEVIRERILGAMSKRAREALQEEMEFMGSVSKEDIGHAQKRVVQILLHLDEKGELTLKEGA